MSDQEVLSQYLICLSQQNGNIMLPVMISGTTDSSGLVVVSNVSNRFTSTPFVLANVAKEAYHVWLVTVYSYNANAVRFRIRNISDGSQVANTEVDFPALLIGK